MSSVFLFGAGASAFSGECIPTAPPLGKDLFLELKKLGGVASRIDGELAEVFCDFEAGMAELRVRDDLQTIPFLNEMAVTCLAIFGPSET